ncbi:MAG: RsmE family RNA methyltransferase [Firmicutes bacterium]|nr:RsmE family RNA methyltransferase [Bacillota bacterium]
MVRVAVNQSARNGAALWLPSREWHYVHRVMRARPGDRLEVLTGDGEVWLATVANSDGLITLDQLLVEASPIPRVITLYQALLKGDRFSEVVDRATQAGVSIFVPIISERTIVRDISSSKWTRWQVIAKEASEQCGRSDVPKIGPLSRIEEIDLKSGEDGYVLHPPVAYDRPWLQPSTTPLALVVGPEGGLTAREVESLQRRGFRPLSLGPRIFRAENAGAVAATLFLQ